MFLLIHWELVYIYSRERKLLLLLEEEIKICVTTLVKETMKIYLTWEFQGKTAIFYVI